MMRRRELITLLGAAAVLGPFAARAQQVDRVRRVGILMPFAASDAAGKRELAGFTQQLQTLGWTDGGNLRIDYRWSAGDPERMQALAKELIVLQPDVIFSRSTPVTGALLKQTRTIPIVFAVVSDPVGEGFIASVARPGGNATGFTNAESSLTGKWLGLLKEMTPGISRVAFIFDPKVAPGGGSYYTKLIEDAAPRFAVAATPMPVHSAADIESAVGEFVGKPSGGLLVLPDATTNLHLELILALAARHRLPAVYAFRYIAAEGGLMSYGVDVVELFRRAADYVNRILRGAKPAELPVQLPEKFQLVLNLKTAAAMGLAVPTSLQLLADEVIE
jgi:putative ABC transport system substrate-binding protein